MFLTYLWTWQSFPFRCLQRIRPILLKVVVSSVFCHTILLGICFIICLQVPTFAYEKRLSRIETLRLAITYISFMDELLATPVSGPAGVSCRRGGGGQVGGHGQSRGVPHLTSRGEELLPNHINPFAGINAGSTMCQQDLSKWNSWRVEQKNITDLIHTSL